MEGPKKKGQRRRGPRSNSITPEDSQPMIFYMLVYHTKPLGPIMSYRQGGVQGQI